MQSRNFKIVPNLLFGKGVFSQLDQVLNKLPKRKEKGVVFVVDYAQQKYALEDKLPLEKNDFLIWADVSGEPTTDYVDTLTMTVRQEMQQQPCSIVGIGGGSSMDLAKAISLMLTNEGGSADYQGWDLIKNPAVHHIGIPALSGSGSEVSRTTVLLGPDKKLGLNSDHTVFDQIIMDPELIANVPKQQWFYTGMDCYIHCIESINGQLINEFGRSFGEKSLELCKEVFVDDHEDKNEKLMIASYMGGMSIAYSQVGACHALSYGLSYVLHTPHGIGNCIAFNVLDDIYSEGVEVYRKMLDIHQISLPQNILGNITEEQMKVMIKTAKSLPPLWENVYGADWQDKVTDDFIRGYYEKM